MGRDRARIKMQNGVMDKHRASVKEALRFRAPALWLKRAGGFVLDQLYPPTCLYCDTPIVDANALCASCWPGLRPITRPMCPVLGLPFAVSLGPEARSAAAIADPPPFDRARSAFIYNDLARAIVSRLKYGDKPELSRFCALTMTTACAEILDGDPVLVPVPLHRFRQWQRRYNQSTELCRALAQLRGLDVAPLLVRRTRRTRQQVGLSAAQRQRNVAGAFEVRAEALSAIAGRRVVIVDDVITTGATVRALTLALKRAGIEQIDVISFARVVIGADMPI